MVLFGLVTVFIKIQQRKTAYYLVRVNAWFVIIILVISSGIHWDETIAKYNLAQKDTITLDTKFLLTLSDKVLPLLEQNIAVLDRNDKSEMSKEGEYLYRSTLTPRQVLENRKHEFYTAQKEYSWLSWNVADEKVKKGLMKGTELSAVNSGK